MTKTCLFSACGRLFGPNPDRPLKDFAKRKFCSVSCASANKAEVARMRLIEDVEWIIDHDHPHSVAKRVGYGDVNNLADKLRDNGRGDLSDKLIRGLERWRAYEVTG